MEIGYGTLQRLLIVLFDLSEPQRGALLGRFKYLQRLGGYGSRGGGRGRARYGLTDTLQLVLIFELIDAGCSPTHALRIVQTYWNKVRVNLAYAWRDVRGTPNEAPSERLLWTVIPHALANLGAGEGMLGVAVAKGAGEISLAEILDWQPGLAGKRHAIVVHLPTLLVAFAEALTVVAPELEGAFATALDRLAKEFGIAVPG